MAKYKQRFCMSIILGVVLAAALVIGATADNADRNQPWTKNPYYWLYAGDALEAHPNTLAYAQRDASFDLGNTDEEKQSRDYTRYAIQFADTILEHGRDKYGLSHTPLFVQMLDPRTLRIPTDKPDNYDRMPFTKGHSVHEMSCFYADTVLLRFLYALSEVTGDRKYAEASDDNIRFVIRYLQSPYTGLLPAGEHAAVALHEQHDYESIDLDAQWGAKVTRNFAVKDRDHDTHEFYSFTPLWEEMWKLDPDAVKTAIEGVWEWHIYDKENFLSNRHAPLYPGARGERIGYVPDGFMDVATPASEINPGTDRPYNRLHLTKHPGIFAYSFAFLHSKTGDQTWLDRARGIAKVKWSIQDEENKTPWRLVDASQRGDGEGGEFVYNGLLWHDLSDFPPYPPLGEAFWLLKAHDSTADDFLAKAGLGYIRSIGYAHSSFRLPRYYIIAYKASGDDWYLDSLRDVLSRKLENWPRSMESDTYIAANEYAEFISASATVYRWTGDTSYLEYAKRLADQAIEWLYHDKDGGGLFYGGTNFPYYASYIGSPALAYALLELGLTIQNPQSDVSLMTAY